MNTSTLLASSATDLADTIRKREVSSEEVIDLFLKRLTELNPIRNTVIQIAPDSAREQARAADEALRRGQSVGPLHGVPFTVKDVYEVPPDARLTTMPGMPEPIHPKAERESTVVSRLRAAGAILIGVTRATLWSDRDEHYGYVKNPYDLTRTVSGRVRRRASIMMKWQKLPPMTKRCRIS